MTELFDQPGTIYREVSLADLKAAGLRQIEVQAGAVALLTGKAGASPRLFKAGSTVKPGDSPLQVFRSTPVRLNVPVVEFASRDGFLCQIQFDATVQLDVNEPKALADFVSQVGGAKSRPQLSAEDIGKYLVAPIQAALKAQFDIRDAESMNEASFIASLEASMPGVLRRLLLAAGMSLENVGRITLSVPELDQIKEKEASARKKDLVAQRENELRRLEMKRRLEIDEFAKALRHSGLLKDLERRVGELAARQAADEADADYKKRKLALEETLASLDLKQQMNLDRIKFEERLAQAKKAFENLPGASLEFFIATLEDPAEKARLYQQLILRDMTPEQISQMSRADRDIEATLERFLGRLAEMLHGPASGRHAVAPVAVVAPTLATPVAEAAPVAEPLANNVHRVLVVMGKRVLAYDPRDYRTVERANHTYDVSSYNLGSLRSVRLDRWNGESVILAGARQGCYVIPTSAPNKVREYAFFTDRVHKGGTNSALISGDTLFATHSEQGLSKWPLTDSSHLSIPFFKDLTVPFETVRGLSRHNGYVYFVAGGFVGAFNPESIGDKPDKVWDRGGKEITSAVATDHALFAGNRDGQLLRWPINSPGETPEMLVQEHHAIYMLRHAVINGAPCLVYGSKAYGVTVRTIGNPATVVRYECDVPIRWADAGGNYIVGVSADQESVFIWHTSDPVHPLRRIVPGDKIQDIGLWLTEW